MTFALSVSAGLLALAFGSVAFGNSLQPISLLAHAEPLCLLLAYEYLADFAGASVLRWLTLCTTLAQTFGAGWLVAFQSAFAFPSTTLQSCTATAVAGTGVGLLVLVALAVQHVLRKRYPSSCVGLYAYPVVLTAAQSVLGQAVGAFHMPASATDWPPLLQMASIFGAAGITFAIYLLGALAFQLCLPATQRAPHLQRHAGVLGVLALALLLFSSGRMYSGSFYQKGMEALLGQQLQASCVIGQDVVPGSEGYLWMWKSTAERVAAGDAFVLWSEEALDVSSEAQEQALLAEASSLLRTTPNCRTYLGLAYERVNVRSADAHGVNVTDGGTLALNHFALFAPNGSLLFNYLKANPVPVVEAEVIAGPKELPVVDTPYGRVAGAICFDLDYPGYIRQAGAAGVDLLLQPSWTWGALGPRHFAGDALRAVENGLTLFRCSSMGVSGIVSPLGTVWHRVITGPRVLLTLPMNLQHRVQTLYVLGGWLLEWVNVALAIGLLVVASLPQRALAPVQRWPSTANVQASSSDGSVHHPDDLLLPLTNSDT